MNGDERLSRARGFWNYSKSANSRQSLRILRVFSLVPLLTGACSPVTKFILRARNRIKDDAEFKYQIISASLRLLHSAEACALFPRASLSPVHSSSLSPQTHRRAQIASSDRSPADREPAFLTNKSTNPGRISNFLESASLSGSEKSWEVRREAMAPLCNDATWRAPLESAEPTVLRVTGENTGKAPRETSWSQPRFPVRVL
jgi:hypothetical protein